MQSFFWENDLRVAKAGMGDWVSALENVTFERRLGSQAERIARIAALAREIAPMVGADPDQAETAAGIAKADLSSEMVYEFPELQGVMGRYYALEASQPEAVAAVCEDHYQPLGPSDVVPTAPLSIAVALADKIDLLTGFWAIDEKPTGSKDPFALRRAALGVYRMMDETGQRIRLAPLFISALAGHQMDQDHEALAQDLLSFVHDRVTVHLRGDGVRHDSINAVLAMPGGDDLALLTARAKALEAFRQTADGENLVQGYRRAANILTQAEEKDGVEYRFGADPKFAETDEERALFAALDAATAAISPAMAAEEFGAAMTEMAKLRAPIDAYFETVQVNSDNQIVRRNRLNLLHQIVEVCSQIADLTKLEG